MTKKKRKKKKQQKRGEGSSWSGILREFDFSDLFRQPNCSKHEYGSSNFKYNPMGGTRIRGSQCFDIGDVRYDDT